MNTMSTADYVIGTIICVAFLILLLLLIGAIAESSKWDLYNLRWFIVDGSKVPEVYENVCRYLDSTRGKEVETETHKPKQFTFYKLGNKTYRIPIDRWINDDKFGHIYFSASNHSFSIGVKPNNISNLENFIESIRPQ